MEQQSYQDGLHEPVRHLDDTVNRNILTSEFERTPYREELIALGLALRPTHLVTLNLHRPASLDVAARNLKRWRVELLRRLFGQTFYRKPADQLFQYLGFAEHSLAGDPHFHLVCRVPSAVTSKFDRIAAMRWKAIVPTGTSDIRLIDDDVNSPLHILIYVTKRLDLRSPVPFVDSRLYL